MEYYLTIVKNKIIKFARNKDNHSERNSQDPEE